VWHLLHYSHRLEEGSTLSYGNLIDIGLDVDISELESALDDIRSQIAGIVTEQDAGMTDESVRDIVRDVLADDGVTEDRVREIFSEMAHDEGEQLIRDTVSGEGYITEGEVRDLIDDIDTDVLDEDDVRRIAGEAMSEADNADIRDLERRFELYATRVDELMQANRQANERLDLQGKRIAELETTLASRPAVQGMSLFELLTQAARILGIAR
jgi:hypothetical protein